MGQQVVGKVVPLGTKLIDGTGQVDGIPEDDGGHDQVGSRVDDRNGAAPFAPNLMDWPLFKEHRVNTHACAETCPLYKGARPDYNVAHYPGCMQVKRCSIRLGLNQFLTRRDLQDIVRAVRKVAEYHLRKRNP